MNSPSMLYSTALALVPTGGRECNPACMYVFCQAHQIATCHHAYWFPGAPLVVDYQRGPAVLSPCLKRGGHWVLATYPQGANADVVRLKEHSAETCSCCSVMTLIRHFAGASGGFWVLATHPQGRAAAEADRHAAVHGSRDLHGLLWTGVRHVVPGHAATSDAGRPPALLGRPHWPKPAHFADDGHAGHPEWGPGFRGIALHFFCGSKSN